MRKRILSILCILLLFVTLTTPVKLYSKNQDTFPYCSTFEQITKDYNIYTFGNFTQYGNDTGGRVAVGGTASITNYDVGQNLNTLTPPYEYLLLNGKYTLYDLKMQHGGIIGTTDNATKRSYKKIYLNEPNYSIFKYSQYQSFQSHPKPHCNNLNFKQVKSNLLSYSQKLNKLEKHSGKCNIKYNWGNKTLSLSGDYPDYNIFNLYGTAFPNYFINTSLKISLEHKHSIVLIKVHGKNIYLPRLEPVSDSICTYNKILWYFPEATNITISHSIIGSIFAPYAKIKLINRGSGQISVKYCIKFLLFKI